MKTFVNKVVAITGAGSGIGQALAVELSKRGAHVAISDIDGKGLGETATRCDTNASEVVCTTLDVADRDAVHDWSNATANRFGRVNMIVNNAGVGLIANVVDMKRANFEWLMNINFWGVVNGTEAFLDHLEASGDGHVVNVSSVFGLVGIPSQSAYNASKFAVRGYTDALRMELDAASSCVSATTIHPGGIQTNIARTARVNNVTADNVGISPAQEFDKFAMTPPDTAAKQILTAVRKNRRRALIGPDAVVFDAASRMPATVFQRLVIAAQKRRVRETIVGERAHR